MATMDVGIGETRARDADSSAATSGANRVMEPLSSEAERGTPLPEVPPNTGEEFD